MIKRTLEIKNYRTIGIDDKRDIERSRIILNEFDEDETKLVGGLKTIIGKNNVGKSNVLDAIEAINNGFEEKDISQILLDDLEPEILITVKHSYNKTESKLLEINPVKREIIAKERNNNGKWIKSNIDLSKVFKEKDEITKMILASSFKIDNSTKSALFFESKGDMYTEEVELIKSVDLINALGKEYDKFKNKYKSFNCIYSGHHYTLNSGHYKNGKIKKMIVQLNNIINKLNKPVKYIFVESSEFDDYNRNFNYGLNSYVAVEMIKPIWFRLSDVTEFVEKLSLSKEEIEFLANKLGLPEELIKIPKVVNYNKMVGFKSSDLIIEFVDEKDLKNKFAENVFFNKLLNHLDMGINIFVKTLEREKKASGYIKKLEKNIDQKMTSTNKIFNNTYTFDDEGIQYIFAVDIQNNRLAFEMMESEMPLMLDLQSTGFKYFFNLFFNIVANDTLSAGDIIIIDEPANTIHPKGQKIIRNILKNFAEKTGITIVLSTVSPFMCDIDHLDELVVIEKAESITLINNKFNEVKKSDVMFPIEESMSIDRAYLLGIRSQVVFVEGIVDYNYLVAMKNLFNHQYSVIQLEGIKKKPEDLKFIFKKFMNPIFFVDSDKAGKKFIKDMKAKYEDNSASYFQINEVLESAIVIEDLFSKADAEKLGIKNSKESKKFYKSKNIKNLLINKTLKLDDETTTNFKKLSDMLEEG